MAALKYSKQRASIKEYLLHTTAHPTADTVYLHIKEEFPNISLGTVYRNLNLLADIGEALRIPTPAAHLFPDRRIEEPSGNLEYGIYHPQALRKSRFLAELRKQACLRNAPGLR